MRRRASDVIEPNNLRLLFSAYNTARDVVRGAREDARFAGKLLRVLGPGARRAPPEPREPLFPESRPLDLPKLRGRRIGIVSSGGSGATAALCGVKRCFEDAGIEPVVLSACSGSMLFLSLWAAGVSAEEMARFWLTMPARDYVDPDWRALLRAPWRGFRGFTGLLAGEAIERSYDRFLGGRKLGETKVPLAAVVWNIDRNQVESLSTWGTPAMPIARAARVAISIPIMVQAVRIGAASYGDGGIVDIFPVQPAVDAGVDHVIGLNFYLPRDFTGEDIGDWRERRWSILRASGQLRYAVYLELAREHVRQLGDKLTLLHPVDYEEVRGARFYETFLDRSAWPRFMAAGYATTREALERLEAGAEGARGARLDLRAR